MGFRLLDDEDGWRWRLEDDGCFSVKSTYEKLEGLVLVEDLWREEEKRVFSEAWKSPAPSKVVAFSWRLLLDRIPIRVNLDLRNVLLPEASMLCVLCGNGPKTTNHLLLHCSVSMSVWRGLMNWLDLDFLIPPNLFFLCQCWDDWERNKKIRHGLWLIQHAAVWVIWRARNCRIFNNKIWNVVDIVEEVKVLFWRWTFNRIEILICMYYEWCWNPKDCLRRELFGQLFLLGCWFFFCVVAVTSGVCVEGQIMFCCRRLVFRSVVLFPVLFVSRRAFLFFSYSAASLLYFGVVGFLGGLQYGFFGVQVPRYTGRGFWVGVSHIFGTL